MLVKLIRNVLARRKLRRRLATRVRACFEGVDMTRHQFNLSGVKVQTGAGDDSFYSAREIDVAITRINELLFRLSS